ncbi:protein TolR [Beggiatoa alba]|nr:protein TolR [Beggiatoa alba]
MAAPVKKRVRRKPMSEINVVPYIDVMLVLLVIFMITAPLLTQGVMVELPSSAESEPVGGEADEPLVVSVTIEGDYYLNLGEQIDEPIGHQLLVTKVAAVLRHRPKTPILIRGDSNVKYGKIMVAMDLLTQAGAPSVGLITNVPEDIK